jgi:hypothetical protein
MYRHEPSGEIKKRLYEALDRLEKDITSIEILAGALTGFSQPIPDYEPSNDKLLRAQEGDLEEHLRD